MSAELHVTGVDQIMRRLTAMARRIPDEVGAALRAEAEIEMTEAKKRTPVLTGVLRASGTVKGPDRRSRDIEVRMEFGGAARGYAIEIHENLEMFHRVGQAKYLESVVMESAPYMPARVARRIELSRLVRR